MAGFGRGHGNEQVGLDRREMTMKESMGPKS